MRVTNARYLKTSIALRQHVENTVQNTDNICRIIIICPLLCSGSRILALTCVTPVDRTSRKLTVTESRSHGLVFRRIFPLLCFLEEPYNHHGFSTIMDKNEAHDTQKLFD